jgi:UDP-glucose-4-epimerase GalE
LSVLVCGGAGYIGSHVNKMLSQKGYETVVLDNLVYGHRQAVKWGTFVQGDLGDKALLDQLFSQYRFEAVIHLAAWAYVGESVAHPEKYYENNVVNTLNLLKAMRRHQCSKLVFSSTCATYGQPEQVPITEDMPQCPINPYGASKLMCERMMVDFSKAYDLSFVALRYFNAAGADPDGQLGESHSPETHLIPLVLDAASGNRESISVFGTDYPTPDGSCIRDYIHVWDLAQAHVLALSYLEQGGSSECLNLGNESGASVWEVIQTACQVTGKEIPVKPYPRREGDPAKLVGSCEKAKQILGWNPQYPQLETIIQHAWNWHQNREY